MTFQKLTKRALLTSVLALAACGGLALPVHAQGTKAKLGYALPEVHPQGQAAKFFADEVRKATAGRVDIQTFSDNKLGDDRAMIGALQGGVQEFSIQSTSPFVGSVKEFGLLDLPFIFSSEKQADAVLDGPVGQSLLGKLSDKGMVGLVYLENGFRQMTNNRRPITKAEELAGLKVRVMQSPVFIDTMKTLGANPTPLAFAELFVALETGAVDGQENPFAIINTSKFYEVQKFLSVTNHVYNAFILTASKTWWDKQSAEDQKAMREAAVLTRDFQRKLNRDQTAATLDALKKSGMKVNEVPAAELARMAEAVKGVREKVTSSYDPAITKAFFEAIEAAR